MEECCKEYYNRWQVADDLMKATGKKDHILACHKEFGIFRLHVLHHAQPQYPASKLFSDKTLLKERMQYVRSFGTKQKHGYTMHKTGTYAYPTA